jgi:hypothetical protein
MSGTCTVVALRLARPGSGAFRIALGLLVAEAAFSVVKLTVYREPESLVFLGLTVAAAVLLLLPGARRHLTGADVPAGARPERVGAAVG